MSNSRAALAATITVAAGVAAFILTTNTLGALLLRRPR